MTAGVDPAVALAVRIALALLLGAAAWHKARDRHGFRTAVADFALLPGRLVGPVATALVAGEITVALALPWAPAAGPLGAAALLSLYAAAMALALARGRRGIDCGCGGVAGGQPLGWPLVARNMLLVGAALSVAVPSGGRTLGWLDSVTIGGAVVTTAALWAAVHGLRASATQARALARVVEGT